MNHEYQTPKTPEELRAAHAFDSDGKELKIVMHNEAEPFLVCSYCDGEKKIRHGGNIQHATCPKHEAELWLEVEAERASLQKTEEEAELKTE